MTKIKLPENFPIPPDPLGKDKLMLILEKDLSDWKVVESLLPENPEIIRTELYREYLFEDFNKVIDYIVKVSVGFEIMPHHPRWENVWTTLRVYLTTWDAVHIISYKDVMLARYMDKVYSEFSKMPNNPHIKRRKIEEIKSFIKQIQDYVLHDDLEKAFESLNKYITLNSEIDDKDDFILLIAQFNRFQRERRIGQLSKDELNNNIARITVSLLELVKTLNIE